MDKCYSVGVNRLCFRAGEPAEIKRIGYQWVDVNPPDYRLVYEIEFYDGETDTIPLKEVGTAWKIISFKDIINGNIPKVDW